MADLHNLGTELAKDLVEALGGKGQIEVDGKAAIVGVTGETTENQIQEIEAVGFHVEPRRIVTETVSGSVAIARRPGFSRLLDRLESGDVLIVTSSTSSAVMRSM